jgi:hypothetical protein
VTMQERNTRAKRTLWVVVFPLVLCAFASYISLAAGSPSENIMPASPLIMTPPYTIALGATAVVAAGILFFLNSHYGPIIGFKSGGQSQQAVPMIGAQMCREPNRYTAAGLNSGRWVELRGGEPGC